jgi:hypothetical protein
MAQSSQTITIENLTNPLPTTVTGTVATFLAQSPVVKGAYIFSVTDAPGVIAANNFMTLVNPVGSGKTVIILGTFVSTYVATGASATRNSLQGMQATAVSGGSLASASAIGKFASSMPNAVAELRTGNPAATPGANLFNSPPAIGVTASQFVHTVGGGASTASGPLTLAPGEGLVIRTAAGNVSQTWNISVVWGEI